MSLWDTSHTSSAPCAYLFPVLIALTANRHWCQKNSLIPMQKTFIRKINSQLTLRRLFCFYAHNPGFLILLVSAISDLWRPILNSCLAQSRHHLPTLRCQMLLLFASSCRISDTAQQPSAELSPPPLTSQLFCRLSSSYSNTRLQFPWDSAAFLQFNCISCWASFLFRDIILISWISLVSCNFTIPGQNCLESCSLFSFQYYE